MFTLRLMTYNIQGHAAARRADHLAAVAEVIRSERPDVVCLQEVHCRTRNVVVDQGEELATLAGLTLAFGRSCGMDGGDYGNAVLTRGKVEVSEVFALPGSGEPRSLMRTDLTVDDTPVSIFVTHLSAWGRLRQRDRLEQIAKVGDVTAGARRPHLLAGDFNVPPRATEIRTLLAHGHLRPSDSMRQSTFPLLRQRLDYVFCSPEWTVVRSDAVRRGPSDHWPLVVEAQLGGS